MANGPIDYSLGAPTPIQQTAQGLALGQGLAQARQQAAQEQERAAKFAEWQQQAPMRAEVAQLALEEQRRQAEQARRLQEEQRRFHTNPDPTLNDFRRLAALDSPQRTQALSQYFAAQGKEKTQALLKVHGQIASALQANDTDAAIAILQERADAAKNEGRENDVKFFDDAIKAVKLDPENARRATIYSMMSIPGGMDMAKSILGPAGEIVQVQRSEILPDGATVSVMKDGSVVVKDSTGKVLDGAARTKAIDAARRYGVDLERMKTGARELGKVPTRLGNAAMDQADKIRQNVPKLREAKRLLDVEGASSGVIQSMWPSLRTATIELENVRNQLGLDVIGSVTFGALSQGELDTAMSVALPKLPPKELSRWLDDKIKAQEKLATYLDEQARFLLSGPDRTVSQWLDYKKGLRKKEKTGKDIRTISTNPLLQEFVEE